MLKFIRDAVILVVIAIGVFFTLQFTLQASVINGSCMEPTVYDGQRLVINKVAVYYEEWQRGEVIVFQPPNAPDSSPYIKRIIGLPGETVSVENGLVYIDGVALDEDYIAEAPRYVMEAVTVPEGHYFVLGDNRNYANDSHVGWTVPEENIIGKAWFTVWPFYYWGTLPVYNPLVK